MNSMGFYPANRSTSTFVYERLGELPAYFVDEFCDTSRMQWENLMPLIENPISQERQDGTRGSLMPVARKVVHIPLARR
jgi:ATP-dependent exoDNAse (exonuclease V) beta subunit